MPTFGSVVKDLRKEKGLTQIAFAEALTKISGELITRSAVSMWEAGKRRPKYEVLEAIADFFNVDMDYLLGKTTERRVYNLAAEKDGVVTEPYEKWIDKDMRLLMWFRSLPKEKQRAILFAQDAPEDLV